MRDPLIGKWFLAIREQDDGSPAWSWRGQIIGKPGGGVFLCFLDSGSQTLVSLGDMRGWEFYDSKDLRDSANADTGSLSYDAHRGPGRRAGAGS